MKSNNQVIYFTQIKQEDQQDVSQSLSLVVNQNCHLLPKEGFNKTFSYKDSQSTQSLQSSTAKVSLLNRSSITSNTNSISYQKKEALLHYSHYLKSFQDTAELSKQQEVKVSVINNRKHLKLTYLPYQSLINSVNRTNIEKEDDDFIFEWIRFMEEYDCEKIGLNITNSQQSNISNNILNKNANLNNQNRVINKNKKKLKFFRKANNQINIRDLVSQFCIPQEIQDLILCKFCLYIQSQYKILKSNEREKQISSIDPQIYQFIFNSQINNDSCVVVNNNENSQTNYPISNQNENAIQIKKGFQDESSDLIKQQKKYHFNMSKYFMLFLLELLSDSHILQLNDIPEAIVTEIGAIVSQIKLISKKNNSSKTNYYNHYHYDVLFLQVNDQTKNTIIKNSKLLEMHLKVFNVDNLDSNLNKQRINIIKQYISQIVLSQLSILKSKIFLSTVPINLSKSVLEDLNSKIDYLYRVEQGIIDLNLGKTINRF